LKLGKLRSPARRRAAVQEVQRALPEVGERRACRVLGQPREVHCYTARVRDDEAPLTGRIVELASVYGRYGVPDHVRSDNGSEFTAKAVRAWLGRVGVKTLCIEPGASTSTGCARTAPSATTCQHRRRSLLDRPPLRSGPSSSDFLIG
jgi:hypothetical protein